MRGGRFSRIVGSFGGGGGGSGDSLTAGNILNGVLDCKWNKTSAVPSLLEIYNTSFVKFNIDTLTPLVLRFADGWDDIDQPKGIVKKLTVAPSNIDLSAKANCHVQICAKVINDELTITTHDIYDPNVGYTVDAIPSFASGYTEVAPYDATNGYLCTKDGWSIWCVGTPSNGVPRYCVNSETADSGDYFKGTYPNNILYLRAPFSFVLGGTAHNAGYNTLYEVYGYNDITTAWVKIGTMGDGLSSLVTTLFPDNSSPYTDYKITHPSARLSLTTLLFYERPTAKFFRSLNKVKDRSDVEQLWINLGYATVDANGAITELAHYTDLRNNYPGGMRVEA